MTRPLWAAFGILSLGCGLAGIVLPLLPTTPFLLLAAWAFARSSPRLHDWLVGHPRLGPTIVQWREYGVIPPRAKAAGILAVGVAFLISLAIGVPPVLLIVQGVVLCGVTAFLLSRPSRIDRD